MKASERRLISLLAVLSLLCGAAILSQRLLLWQGALERREQSMELKQMESRAMLAEASLWKQRLEWLHAHQPGMTSENQASEKLLEELLSSAATHRLTVQKKQLHEASSQPSYQEVSVTLTVQGEMPDVFRWMHAFLAPEAFQSVSRFKITPDPTDKTKTSATVRVNRLHAPAITATTGAGKEGPGT